MQALESERQLESVRYFRSPDDDRVVAIHILASFDEFEKFPPCLDTEEEVRHLEKAYSGTDPANERREKAHITDDSWPLQVIMLERSPGGTTNPHYHVPDVPLPDHPTRHQILLCQSGRARIKVLTIEKVIS